MNKKEPIKFFGNYPRLNTEEKLNQLNKHKMAWQDYARSRQSLLKSQIVRSHRAPEAEFSEWLVKILYNGNINRKNNEKGYDLTCLGKVIEVKSLSGNRVGRFGYDITVEDRKNEQATHFVFVLFNEFVPQMIFEIEINEIRKFHKKHIGSSDIVNIGRRVDTPGLLDIFSP